MPRIKHTDATNRRLRNWCFTINNPKESDDIELSSLNHRYLCYQLEIGKGDSKSQGTPHYQGVVVFKNALTFTALKKKLTRAHIEPCQNLQASIDYCQKEEGRLDGPWVDGSPPTQGVRNDLIEMRDRIVSGDSLQNISHDFFGSYIRYNRGIKDFARMHTPGRDFKSKVVVFYGPSGIGKTRAVQGFPDAHNMLSCHGGPGSQQFFDNYDPLIHKSVIFDDFYGTMPFTEWLRVNDEYPHLVHTKGGSVQFRPDWICYTSNVSPSSWYPKMVADERRADSFFRRLDVVIEFKSKTQLVVHKGSRYDLPGDVQELLKTYQEPTMNDVLIYHEPVAKKKRAPKLPPMSSLNLKTYPPSTPNEPDDAFSGGIPPTFAIGYHPREDPNEFNKTRQTNLPYRLDYDAQLEHDY